MKSVLLVTTLFVCTTELHAQQFVDRTTNLPLDETAEFTMDVEAFDADGDGDLDLVIASEFKENWLLFNDGNGFFSVDTSKRFPLIFDYGHTFIEAEDSEDIAIADFDGDNDPDILFVTEDTDYHELLFNNGTGTFTLAPNQIPKTINCNTVLAEDFNGDSLVDVLLGHTGQNRLFLNDGTGVFQPDSTGIWPTNTDFTQDLKIGDFDGDGDWDIVEGIENGGNNLYINQGTHFEEQTAQRLPILPLMETRKVAVADVDSDGDIDLFFCNVGWTAGIDPQDRLLLNNGKGFFTDATSQRFPYSQVITLDALFLDLNGDKRPDLITSGNGEARNYRVYFNRVDSPGYFVPEEGTLPYFQLNTGIAMCAADLNGDSLTDLYFGNKAIDRLFLQHEIVAGFEEASTAHDIQLYPTIVEEQVWIEHYSSTPLELELYDMQGKRLLAWTIPAGRKSINLATLAKGTYVVHAVDSSHKQTWTVIKQ